MGLSGRKTKQRIPDDPRNLCWADDAARFGSNYLAKFGWDGSTGLGVAGEGRTSHIKVSHKLDLLGIGAAQQNDPDGIAWKQNKDFERLLQRLNDESAAEKNQALESGNEEVEIKPDACITEKKRKHREDGESKTERKKKRKADMDIDDKGRLSSNNQSEKIETTVVQVKKVVIVPRHRAHRARAIHAKNILSKSAAQIAEILGIAPTSSRSDSGEQLSERAQGKLTSLTDEVEIEKITTSTKSVTDYFKEKLKARSSSAVVSTFTTPRDSDDSYDTPQMGLGSQARLEILTATGEVEQETQGMGLSTVSAFSSSLVYEKPPKDQDSPQINPETKDKEKKRKGKKVKNEETENENNAGEDNDDTKRDERKRRRKLGKEEKDSQDNLKKSKKQEKRKRKAEKLQVSVTSPHTETPADKEKPQKERKEKKGIQVQRVEHAEAYVL